MPSKASMRAFFHDSNFFTALFKLWLPITLQQLIFSLLNLVTVAMIGQLGETAVAAVGLGNQVLFLFQLFLFGVGSGAAIYVAQFWGSRDLTNIHRMLGIGLALGLSGSIIFSFLALAIPERVLAIYSTDRAVIALGSEYLRIAGLGYIAVAISTSYAITLRSTGNVRLPVAISITALVIGAGLNYAFIFGHFGLPALGVQGSAIGALLARWLECALLLFVVYSTRSAAAASIPEMRSFDLVFLSRVLKNIIPVTLNEIIWSLGITMYNVVFARIGTEAVAATSIAGTIENLAFTPFIGLANSAAVLIGHRIGAGEEHRAFAFARRFMILVLVGGIMIGTVIFLASGWALDFYKVDANTRQFAQQVLTVIAIALTIKVSNMMLIVGILRAGGDTRVSAVIDVSTLWLVGLPLAALGAFVWGLPVYWVYALTIVDELCKVTLAVWRVLSKKWLRNLARQHSPAA